MKKIIKFLGLSLCGILIFTGCEKTTKSKSNDIVKKIEANSKETAGVSMFEEDGMIIYTNHRTSEVFYTKGDKVTNYEIYIEAASEEEAKGLYPQYETQYKDDYEFFESTDYCGKYVIIKFKQEHVNAFYGTDTVKGIKEIYSYVVNVEEEKESATPKENGTKE